MKKYQFSILIDAPKELVWKTLWDDETYRQWTAAFSEVSYAETDWKKGSKVRFLDGKGNGMVSEIAENKPNEFMSFRHLGTIENGVEDFDSLKVKEWAGAMENYSLKTVDGKTQVIVDIDITDEFADMFNKMWPDALQRLRNIAEKQSADATSR